ncbi:MAG: SpoIID/LytB domain-containing protein, partial [Lapillicoccus sp.]
MTALLGVLALVGLGGLVGIPTSPAARAESVPTPSTGVFTLDGHGWGHGTGMSVYGAQGAALQGVPYDQILQHYYPGTALSSYPNSTIRVRLTLDASQIRVPAQAGLVAVDGSGNVMSMPGGYSQFRMVLVGGGLQLQGYNGSWVAVSLAGSTSMITAARFETTSTGILRVYRPDSSSVGYRGAVFAWPSSGSLLTILHTPLEQYLRSVVPSESPPSWAAAELRAQAVAARSIAAQAIAGRTGSS